MDEEFEKFLDGQDVHAGVQKFIKENQISADVDQVDLEEV